MKISILTNIYRLLGRIYCIKLIYLYICCFMSVRVFPFEKYRELATYALTLQFSIQFCSLSSKINRIDQFIFRKYNLCDTTVMIIFDQ